MMVQPKTHEAWVHIHWHQDLLAQKLAQQQSQGGGQGQDGQNKVSESISYKDLPPDGQKQMAAQAGIKIAPPPPQATQQPQQPGQGAVGQSGANGQAKKPNVTKTRKSPQAMASPLKTEMAGNLQGNNQ
jgi:hypothetical protein